MSARPRTTLVVALVLAVVIGSLVGIRWLMRADTIDGTAPLGDSAVILIPGYGGGSDVLAGLAGEFRSAGRTVLIADLGDQHGDIRGYGADVSRLAARLVADGATGVDLVGYSEGGLIARAALATDPRLVRRIATVATPHAGTALAGLGAMLADSAACPTACQQMAPDSEFLASLQAPGDATRWLSAYSANDDVVRPADSSYLDGATNVEVTECGTGPLDHGGIIRSATVWSVVTTFLESGSITAGCTP
jgi:pimeloyl-ACP methyl ester carboxylesterase